MNKEKLSATLRAFLPGAVILTLLSLCIYIGIQQSFRMNADDPQIEWARNAAAALSVSEAKDFPALQPAVDIANSLSAYIVVFDETGKPVTSTGVLDGAIPSLPAGVFSKAKARGENRITWQPKDGVRSAIVVVPFTGVKPGFIAAGRSLKEVENRVEKIGYFILIFWILSLVILFFSYLISFFGLSFWKNQKAL